LLGEALRQLAVGLRDAHNYNIAALGAAQYAVHMGVREAGHAYS
jgi:hypothetical protein